MVNTENNSSMILTKKIYVFSEFNWNIDIISYEIIIYLFEVKLKFM